jgi:GT2 family glycosyltransferase
VFAFTDDDCEADPSWLAILARSFETRPDLGLVGGALLPTATSRRFGNCPQLIPREALYDPIPARRQAPPGWDWAGGNFAVRAAIVKRAGPFDECLGAGIGFPSCEDTDYKLRLESLGVKMRTTPYAIVHHTYGARYGLKALLAHQRNYARGKWGDGRQAHVARRPRGEEWLKSTRRECLVAGFKTCVPIGWPRTFGASTVLRAAITTAFATTR